jgi:hypothetical protein
MIQIICPFPLPPRWLYRTSSWQTKIAARNCVRLLSTPRCRTRWWWKKHNHWSPTRLGQFNPGTDSRQIGISPAYAATSFCERNRRGDWLGPLRRERVAFRSKSVRIYVHKFSILGCLAASTARVGPGQWKAGTNVAFRSAKVALAKSALGSRYFRGAKGDIRARSRANSLRQAVRSPIEKRLLPRGG